MTDEPTPDHVPFNDLHLFEIDPALTLSRILRDSLADRATGGISIEVLTSRMLATCIVLEQRVHDLEVRLARD